MSDTSTSRSRDLARLEARLEYEFLDRNLLEQALTHKSHSGTHNERLEFLGDAVLGLAIAETLYRDHPELGEDALTLIRAELVRRDTLAEVALELGLGEFLRLGSGELKSGGRGRISILADALEAVIGGVMLDRGFDAARALVRQLYSDHLGEVRRRGGRADKDAKTRLQEILQGAALPLPVYEVVETRGSEHRRTFTVSCRVAALDLVATGQGGSRRAAEKAAALAMIDLMDDE